jgi:hypothetical protein
MQYTERPIQFCMEKCGYCSEQTVKQKDNRAYHMNFEGSVKNFIKSTYHHEFTTTNFTITKFIFCDL